MFNKLFYYLGYLIYRKHNTKYKVLIINSDLLKFGGLK